MIIELHGKPRAAVISVEDLERLAALEERERREEAVRLLEEIAPSQAERNNDLSDEGD